MNNETDNLDLDRNDQYRDRYRLIMKWLSIFVVSGLVFLCLLVYLIFTMPRPHYFATTRTGQLVPLSALDEPVVTDTYLKKWAMAAAEACFNMNFNNYEQALKAASVNFTSSGWDSVRQSLKKAGVLSSLSDNKLFINSIVSNTPVILSREVVQGRYNWVVQFPLLLTYTSASEHSQKHLLITMNVERVPNINTAKSIQINRFRAE